MRKKQVKKKIITFLMPRTGGSVPTGGYKIVYEYANQLIADDFIVNIVYPCGIDNKLRALLKVVYYFFKKDYTAANWFKLNPKIKEMLVFSLAEKYIPSSNVIFATGWKTAECLAKYKRIKSKNKFYLIQGYEDWAGEESRMLQTWRADLQKIVISPWLQKIATDIGEKAVLIENGLDFDYFRLTEPIAKRNPLVLCMLYHQNIRKGFWDGLQAVQIVKKIYPELKLNVFGAIKPKQEFPKWITYYQRPNKKQHNFLYNTAAIFIAPSHAEGFGLTPAEAMQCGCAIACTDIGGYKVFCQPEKTALISPIGDTEALAKNIIRLIEDKKLRITLAKNGNAYVQKFTWERAYSKLKKLIESAR